MEALLLLNPVQALHDYWRHSSPEGHLAFGSASFGAWLAHVDWAAGFAFFAYATTIVIGTLMQLYKQWRFIQLEIGEKRRELKAHRTAPAETVAG